MEESVAGHPLWLQVYHASHRCLPGLQDQESEGIIHSVVASESDPLPD